MKKELDKLDGLKKNPFKVPDGYMDNLTSQIMNQLPEKPVLEVRKVSLRDRMRPWMYMAAMFAGLGLFFKFFVATPDAANEDDYALSQSGNIYRYESMDAEEDDFYEHLHSKYEDILLADEWKYFD